MYGIFSVGWLNIWDMLFILKYLVSVYYFFQNHKLSEHNEINLYNKLFDILKTAANDCKSMFLVFSIFNYLIMNEVPNKNEQKSNFKI